MLRILEHFGRGFSRRARFRAALSRERARGRGLYLHEWHFPEAAAERVSETVLGWCREVAAETPRPYGISHFDLAFASHEPGRGTKRLRLHRVEAAEVYGRGLSDQLVPLLREGATLGVAVALVSWGEITHAALH